LDPASLTIIANTGDDIELFGLHISPDLDTIAYTLSGRVHGEQGWGVTGESWNALEALKTLGGPDWFRLGDRDLGLHLFRTGRLREGATLTEVSREIGERLGLSCTLLPMCDDSVPTRIVTDEGDLHLQEYLVRRRCEPVVRAIRFEGIAGAKPASGVPEAIDRADLVILAPSNPLISIGPILAVPGLREALAASKARRVAVSPIVAGKALKGPAAKMMLELGLPVNQETVARVYLGAVDTFVLDEQDRSEIPKVQALGMHALALPTVMESLASKQRLARDLLALLG
jgi:LPPG:FO 2-phospho-L-lactate transferase